MDAGVIYVPYIPLTYHKMVNKYYKPQPNETAYRTEHVRKLWNGRKFKKLTYFSYSVIGTVGEIKS